MVVSVSKVLIGSLCNHNGVSNRQICIPCRPWDERLLSKITRPKTVGEYEYCLLKMSIKKMNSHYFRLHCYYSILSSLSIVPGVSS